jgi:type I restriction enzyme S subunit
MTTWREVSISELARGGSTGVAGGPFGSSLGRKHYTPAGVPVIRGAQLSGPGRFSLDDLVFVSEEKANRHPGNLAHPGDVIVTQRGTLGQVGLVPSDQPYKRFLLSQSQMKISPDPAVVDSEFLYFALTAPESNQRLVDHAMAAGVPHINLATLRDFRIEVADIRTQRRVAAVLSAFDELIEINERRIDLLEDLARSLYAEWFLHFRFPGHKDIAFVDSEVGPIPEGWEVRSLGELVTTQYGYTASASAVEVGPKFLRGMDINKASYIDWCQVPYCEIDDKGAEKFRLEVGDICVIRMADPGKVGIVEAPVDAVFASYLVRLRSIDPRLPPYMLFHFLDSAQYQDWISGSSTGATRKSASAKVLTEPKLVVPPAALAGQYQSFVADLRGHLSTLIQQSARLVATRDLLLPRLISGRLDLADVDLGVLTPAVE